jgi:hypothetical protein
LLYSLPLHPSLLYVWEIWLLMVSSASAVELAYTNLEERASLALVLPAIPRG